MKKPLHLSDDEHAELVAFLDGELAGDAARAVEARINVEPAYRAEAESLKRAWEMLDYLPQVRAGPALHRADPVEARRPSRRAATPPPLPSGPLAGSGRRSPAAGRSRSSSSLGAGLPGLRPGGAARAGRGRPRARPAADREQEGVRQRRGFRVPPATGPPRPLRRGRRVVKPLPGDPRHAMSLVAGADPGGRDRRRWRSARTEHDALEQNRRLLERWRADPEHHARLLRDLRAFYALPRPRQQQLRLLDQQLYAADGPDAGAARWPSSSATTPGSTR